MDIQDTLTKASNALAGAAIDFALIGGFALAAHGVVRATQDIDLLVDGIAKDKVKKALQTAGFNVVYESEEVMHLSGQGQLDILFSNRSQTKQMIKNAKKINGFPVPVVSAEGIIGLKIQAYKNDSKREFQDKADIQALLEVCDDLDLDKIKIYADLFNEWPFIEKLREKLRAKS